MSKRPARVAPTTKEHLAIKQARKMVIGRRSLFGRLRRRGR